MKIYAGNMRCVVRSTDLGGEEVGEVRKEGQLIIAVVVVSRKRDFLVYQVQAVVSGESFVHTTIC